jgi:hypothetical protein
MKSIANKSLADIDVNGHIDDFMADNERFFKIISDVSKDSIIVDTSKDLKRLEFLLQIRSLSILPIYLTRDPKGQICSVQERAIRLGDPWEKDLIDDAIRRYNKKTRSILALLDQVVHFNMQYESLVRDPKGTLKPILSALGLEFEPQQLQWSSKIRHAAGGNRMAWHLQNELKLDERWRTRLRAMQKMAINLGTLPSRHSFPKSFELILNGLSSAMIKLSR